MSNPDTSIAIVIIVISLIIAFVLGYLTLQQKQSYDQCSTMQSPLCVQWGCNQSGKLCGNSSIRYNSDKSQYYCSNAPEYVNDVKS